MAHVYKTLGRSAPVATTDTDLYVPAASSWAIVSLITVANRGTTTDTFRIAVKNASGAPGTDDYIVYDATILPGESKEMGKGVALLGGTDRISVYASTANLTFLCFGDEIT